MVRYSTEHPKLITILMVLVALALGALIPRVKVDTDPENMLSRDDPARVYHDEMKHEFSVYDMIVVGVVNEDDPDGVFNPESLRKIHELTVYSESLRGEKLLTPVSEQQAHKATAAAPPEAPPAAPAAPASSGPPAAPALPEMPSLDAPALPDMSSGGGDLAIPELPAMGAGEETAKPSATPPEPAAEGKGGREDGVVVKDLLAPSTVDRISYDAATHTIRFSYLMSEPLPQTREQALAVRDGALDNPLLKGTVVSADGKAVCIYLPITRKDISYKVSQRLQEEIARLGGPEKYYITGLPVAEDTFGHEMFVQMAVSAPLAMLVIFILMFVFFRKLVLIISPMIVAMVSVIITMGLLIGLGYTVHIMSSMIPIFIMPIAVLDAIHILSEFFDRYQATRDRKATILKVMDELFVPMLYTSLTSAAGFASLALTPIPPVQVFGLFVAFGIMTAWVLTVTFIPAYVMFIPERRLANFGVSHAEEAPDSLLSRILHRVGGFTHRRTKLILTAALILFAVAVYGICRIQINDNPTKWFVMDHPIRVADRVLNAHFAGTYQAYLTLTPADVEPSVDEAKAAMMRAADVLGTGYAEQHPDGAAIHVFADAAALVDQARAADVQDLAAGVKKAAEARRDGDSDDVYADWNRVISAMGAEVTALQEEPFKRPDVLRYMADLQQELVGGRAAGGDPVVGKTNAVTDIIKKVQKELTGDPERYRIPETVYGVAGALLTFQTGHRPDDLWHFVTSDYRQANMWLQLKSGDNRDMERVIEQVDAWMAKNPPPVALEHNWFGLTYINVAWQKKMVRGMLQAFAGSFVVVFILMTVLFHSALWGLLCMIPLTLTIGLIYGLIGLVGKDYDMPVAVLSSLTLGLAVDFAIHFLARARNAVREAGSWDAAAESIFGEPARAISRNAIVVAVGFLPLLAAPLVPYKTVGLFMAGILGVAAVGTLLILPALVTVLQKRLFAAVSAVRITCNCSACMVASVAVVLLLAISFQQSLQMGWTSLGIMAVVLIPLLVGTCGFMCRRRECRRLALRQEAQDVQDEETEEDKEEEG